MSGRQIGAGGLPRWIRRGGRRCSSLRFLLVCCVFLAKWTVDGREGKSTEQQSSGGLSGFLGERPADPVWSGAALRPWP